MPRFFIAGTNILGGMAFMRGRDAEHVHVLRLRPGDDVILCDTEGSDYKCRIVKATREEVEAEVLEVTPCRSEPSVKASVLCALPKGSDKTDYIIQKSVEAGAFEICFFSSERCVAKLDEGGRAGSAFPKKPPNSPVAESSRRYAGSGTLPSALTLPLKRISVSLCMKPASGKASNRRCRDAGKSQPLPSSPVPKAALPPLKQILPE